MEPSGAATEPAPGRDSPAPADQRRHLVALLAAAAAVVIAILGVRASFLGGEASGAWQDAVRLEVKRAAATVEDIRYLYESEATTTLQLVRATLLAEEYRRAADATPEGPVRSALLAEAGRADQLVQLYRAGSLIAAEPHYAINGGGYDLVARLVDLRAANPDLVVLDPDALERTGDAAASKASGHLRSAIPVALSFLAAALANGFPRRRRPLLAAGLVTLLIGIVSSLGVEVGLL